MLISVQIKYCMYIGMQNAKNQTKTLSDLDEGMILSHISKNQNKTQTFELISWIFLDVSNF